MIGLGGVGSYGFSNLYRYGGYRAANLSPVEPVKHVTGLPVSGVDGVTYATRGYSVAPVGSASAQSASNADKSEQVGASGAAHFETAEELMRRYESDPAEIAVRQRIQDASGETTEEVEEKNTSPAEKMEEEECQTCANRKYQDGSDDPGVSFKTAAHIAPQNAASVVRGHEMEHVVRERAKAEREGREVVQQSVTLHTGICPECGDVFVSGGTTQTTTKANQSEQNATEQQGQGNSAATPAGIPA